jgi:signal transduction histidine kinase/ActR/RegA family two-component response regulator
MPSFRALPIRSKLVLIAVGSAAAALVLASAISLASTYVLSRRAVRVDVAAQSSILADNIAAALMFKDHPVAQETLRALRAKPTIDVACVYDEHGGQFVRYASGEHDCPEAAPADLAAVARDGVMMVRGVTFGGRRVGTLYVHGNLVEVAERFGFQAVAAGVSLLVGLLVAFIVSRRLQQIISRPILHLSETSARISREQDYSVRAVKTNDDEIGSLVEAFNAMLRQVEKRDTELSLANAVLSREIIERQKGEVERTELLRREREANRLKDEFLAALSHELRTPLNAILGWAQILQTRGDQISGRALASIERNARAQARMIEDLLDISRIVSGKFHLKTGVVELVPAIDAALDLVRPAAAVKALTLSRVVPEEPCFVSGDYDRLQQVFWNLLSNAVKFTPTGGTIDVRVEAAGDACTVAIRDTGIGISPDFLPHVFDRFRQADGSMAREHGGLGLGLAIVQDIVTLHGGSVSAHSEGRNRGATFIVKLPQLQGAARQRGAPGENSTSLLLKGISVLVADDDADAREIAAAALAEAGATVETVRSAREAIDALERRPFSVLVSDIGMPEIDGYSLIKLLRAGETGTDRTIPAIAMTAYASDDDRNRAAAAGYQAHVAKPFDVAMLVRTVASVTGAQRVPR